MLVEKYQINFPGTLVGKLFLLPISVKTLYPIILVLKKKQQGIYLFEGSCILTWRGLLTSQRRPWLIAAGWFCLPEKEKVDLAPLVWWRPKPAMNWELLEHHKVHNEVDWRRSCLHFLQLLLFKKSWLWWEKLRFSNVRQTKQIKANTPTWRSSFWSPAPPPAGMGHHGIKRFSSTDNRHPLTFYSSGRPYIQREPLQFRRMFQWKPWLS